MYSNFLSIERNVSKGLTLFNFVLVQFTYVTFHRKKVLPGKSRNFSGILAGKLWESCGKVAGKLREKLQGLAGKLREI